MATSVADWLNEGNEHTLPSGKVVRLRDVDVLSILTEGGEVPNFLLKQMNAKNVKAAQEVEVSAQDMLKMAPLLDKLAVSMFIEPRVSTNADEVQRGEAIAPHHVGLQDKLKLIEIGMGGMAAVQNAERFPKE